ncbi:MAG: DUF3370 family protein [Deltaproteobacteria bacterium]|nr:DUF3370 family protein [Deltaproteobacteria bacterium]
MRIDRSFASRADTLEKLAPALAWATIFGLVACATEPDPSSSRSDRALPADGGGIAHLDSALVDGRLDATVQDVLRPDAGPRDMGSLDGARVDVGSLDAGALDADAPDARAPDASLPWRAGILSGPPSRAQLLPLPGGGSGPPVLTSNNPEIFEGPGLLYGNARPSPTRGGTPVRLEGEFGVYLHHLNRSGSVKYVGILVTNPNAANVTIEARGSGYSQTETGGLGLGSSPDFRVSREWILDLPETIVQPTEIQPSRGLLVWQKRVNDGAEVDGRFGLRASAPVFVYVLATDAGTLSEALTRSREDAPGDYRTSGSPPPPYGREAGVYAHDTWTSTITVSVPAGPKNVAFMVNTATGGGLPQIQAFPAIGHYDVSAAEAVGMYGNVYDFELTLIHDGADSTSRRVRVAFHSLATGTASRWWDGAGVLDGAEIVVRHVPGAVTTTLGDFSLGPRATRTLRFRAMVPGLAAIPQALSIETF